MVLLRRQVNPQIISEPLLSNAPIDWSRLNNKQVFKLIDSTLSFEACLYHQILPLALKEGCLKLGMVNPEDTAAVEYVERILSYTNCSLVFQPIDTEFNQAMLSAYLKYTEVSKPAPPRNAPLPSLKLLADNVTVKGMENETPKPNQNNQPTLILAYPEVVKLEPTPPTSLLEFKIPPQQFLEELIGRMAAEGIDRLYFERQTAFGRILWSHNGVLKPVFEELPLPVFQGLLNELKQLSHLPLSHIQEPKQVEIKYLYKQDCLLLRLRVMPGIHGEEVTLQILRGAALKLYQRQQIEHLSQDALQIAQQLQCKLQELQQTQLSASLNRKLEPLPALKQLLESLERNIQTLKQKPIHP